MEVVPGESEAPIKSVLYYDDSSWVCQEMAEMMRDEEEGSISSRGELNTQNRNLQNCQPSTDSIYQNCDSSGSGEGQPLTPKNSPLLLGRAKKYHLKFDGLLPKIKDGYKFVFSTEIDGKTVAQTIREFECTEL